MTPRTARRLLACHYEDSAGHVPGNVSKAARVVEKDSELAGDYRRQLDFDRRMGGAVSEIQLPPDLEERLAGKLASLPRHKPGLRDPAILAVAIGGFLLVALIAWQAAGRPATASPEITLVAEEVLGMDGAGFERVALPLDAMADWLVLQGFEGFPENMPEHLRDALVDAAAVDAMGGSPRAVMDLAGGEGRLVVFPAKGMEDVAEFTDAQLWANRTATLAKKGAMVFLLLR
jgi:hypothetical protein